MPTNKAVTVVALPEGFHYADASDLSGYERKPWIVENDLEVEFWWSESSAHRPEFTCAYCAATYQAHSKDGALRWWKAHDCDALYAAESEALVYDLTDRIAA